MVIVSPSKPTVTSGPIPVGSSGRKVSPSAGTRTSDGAGVGPSTAAMPPRSSSAYHSARLAARPDRDVRPQLAFLDDRAGKADVVDRTELALEDRSLFLTLLCCAAEQVDDQLLVDRDVVRREAA